MTGKQGIGCPQGRKTQNQIFSQQEQRQEEQQGPSEQLRNTGLQSNASDYQEGNHNKRRCFGQDIPTEALDERIEQENLKKDLDSLFDEVLHKDNPSFDSKIFHSSIFKEAEDLLSNSPFNKLLTTLSHDVKQRQTRFAGNVPEKILLCERALTMDKKQITEDIQCKSRL